MIPILRTMLAFALALAPALGAARDAERAEPYRIAWSIYAGWMPWGYIAESGIMDRHAAAHGVEVEILRDDYLASVEGYVAGRFDAVTVTNMDALAIPGAAGVDGTALIVGDYSNGNDAVILRDAASLEDLRGRTVHLVSGSVSHYLLARALGHAGLEEADLGGVEHVSDAEIVGAWRGGSLDAVVTWNPLASAILQDPEARAVFTSADVPGEIVDLLLVRTEALEARPGLGRALVGAWYEAMAVLASDGPEGRAAREAMARAAATDRAGYEAQLARTRLFLTPDDALAFVTAPRLERVTRAMTRFLSDEGLLGGAGPDALGVVFPDGTFTGDPGNVVLRYEARFVREAAQGGP